MAQETDPPAAGPACPICARPMQARWRPFCSRRCADVDLNRWLSGVYAVPVRAEEDEDGDMPPPAPAADRGGAPDEAPDGSKVIHFPRDRRRRR